MRFLRAAANPCLVSVALPKTHTCQTLDFAHRTFFGTTVAVQTNCAESTWPNFLGTHHNEQHSLSNQSHFNLRSRCTTFRRRRLWRRQQQRRYRPRCSLCEATGLTCSTCVGQQTTYAVGQSQFATAMHVQVCGASGNLVYSPFSMTSALAMLYAGANGNTATEMKSALRFELDGAPLYSAFSWTDHELASRGKLRV